VTETAARTKSDFDAADLASGVCSHDMCGARNAPQAFLLAL
jgi:hypothetical protein